MMNGAETIPSRGIFKGHKPTNRAVTPVTPRLNETDRLPFRYYYTSLYQLHVDRDNWVHVGNTERGRGWKQRRAQVLFKDCRSDKADQILNTFFFLSSSYHKITKKTQKMYNPAKSLYERPSTATGASFSTYIWHQYHHALHIVTANFFCLISIHYAQNKNIQYFFAFYIFLMYQLYIFVFL